MQKQTFIAVGRGFCEAPLDIEVFQDHPHSGLYAVGLRLRGASWDQKHRMLAT